MTKSLVLRRCKSTKVLLRENMIFIIVSAVFLFGILIGSFSVSICDNYEFFGISDYFNSYIKFLNNADFKTVFFNTVFSLLLLILFNYLSGLCVVGNFIISVILFLFAFGIGSVSAFLYRCYSLTGICFFTLVILPGLFVFCINFILSYVYSFKFSARLFALTRKNSSVSVDFKSYTAKYSVFVILTVFSSLLSAFVTVNFSSVFNF